MDSVPPVARSHRPLAQGTLRAARVRVRRILSRKPRRARDRAAKASGPAAPRVRTGLTVLIPAYNEAKFVADTIRSVQQQTTTPDRIVVVDDCSKDGTGGVARACAEGSSVEIIVVRPEKNCGSKATALNYGLGFVESEFTLAIDADTTLAPDAIEKLMPGFLSPTVACVTGMVIPRRVRSLWERGRYVEYLYAFMFYKPIQDYYGRPLIASGCFSAFRTSILRDLGGWSTRTVGEDMDLTWSIYRQGHHVRFCLDAVCYPIEPHTFDFLHKQLTRWSAGFAQNVKVHWRGALDVPYLRSMVAVALWDAVMAVVGLFILIPILMIFVHPLFVLGYFLDLPTIMVPVLIMAHQRGETRRALACLPAFWCMRFVNSIYIVRAFWNEFIVNRSLHTFEKGH